MHYKLSSVIHMVEENCTNCHQCIAVCPIKYCNNGSGDTVKINSNLCIGCGNCITACINSHNGCEETAARHYFDGTSAMLKAIKSKPIAALIAPSAQCNFDLPRLITALRKLGFTAVYDVSLGAEITVAAYHNLLTAGQFTPPLIAQPCPAVVNYIELNHPNLIPHLAPIGSPVHNTAVYIKNQHPDFKLAFISPCLAKTREFSESKLIDYNITFKSIDALLKKHKLDLGQLPPGAFDNAVPAGIAACFSLPGGLKTTYLHHYPDTNPHLITQVGGSIVYEKYLADLETAIQNQSPHLPLIVDVINCSSGCNMGPGCVNHYCSIDEVSITVSRRAMNNITDNDPAQLTNYISQLDFSNYQYQNYKDLTSNLWIKLPTQQDLENIYQAMLKNSEKDFRNCAACGYNSCYRMAVAIFNGLNKAQNCHLYQEKALLDDQERFHNIAREIARSFNEVQDSVSEFSSTHGVTLNDFNSSIQSIGLFRNMSAEFADQVENLTPLIQIISSIAQSLQEQLYFVQQMIETLPTPIFFRNTEGVLQGCNRALEEVIGQARSDIVGKHLHQVFPRELADNLMQIPPDLIDPDNPEWFEGEFTYANGTTRNIIFAQAPFYNINGEIVGVVGVNVDMTDQKRMEQEVMRLDRLRVVGEMAAGIAHEIRNPMTTVRGFLQMMLEQPDLDNYMDYIDMMVQEVDSANRIIGEFLSLAKDNTINLKLQNINSTIVALAPLLNAQALKQDKWISVAPGDIPDIFLDAQQIRQLVFNLARNGLDAMEPGGLLSISTFCTDNDVVLVVADQGHGIDPHILPKLGTPFFTTKEQGTGLGLAVCYSIVARHNARIEVETGNQGTAFIIYFKQPQLMAAAE